ncbi:hypothetical protein [Qipengyuania huizhouensis]|uniref:hypothetical protein n=1 Tax=Qipengyuania huizhouensis TaxID=2867245 RepID=UPI001C872897|nr:hypothetical protein [Qipengyuania huizhouensis]MBX7460431.1 hypothetical protein [Qipengyuania huizhouensis]
MMNLPTILRQTSTKRTSALSEGSKLCGIILAICAAPLFVVEGWMAIWLLSIISLVGLGTFGLWFYKELKGKNLPTEEHTENMAAISLMGQNRDGKEPIIEAIMDETPVANPRLGQGEQAQ